MWSRRQIARSAAAAALPCGGALAQACPVKPIRPLVPFAPGGAPDIVAKATPDGYTLLFNTGSHTINPAVYKKLPFDTLEDFEPVSLLKTTPGLVLVVGPGTKATTIKAVSIEVE